MVAEAVRSANRRLATEPGTAPDLFPDRPPISTPSGEEEPSDRRAESEVRARQPVIGLVGILFVLPVAIVLAVGAGSFEASLRTFGPVSTFALPVVAMIALWWEDWPGTKFRAPFSGLIDMAIVIVGGVLLTLLAQAMVGRGDLRGLFDATPRVGGSPAFPATMALGGAFFVAVFQVTLVNEGWPLRRLGRTASGPIALALSWAIALTLYLALVNAHPTASSGLYSRPNGPLEGPEFGAILICIGFWQAWVYVGLRGWPFTKVTDRARRLLLANVTVLASGVLLYVVLHSIGVSPTTLSAVIGVAIVAVLLQGMLFSGLPRFPRRPATERLVSASIVAAATAGLYMALLGLTHQARWTTQTPEEWIAYAALNGIGIGVIAHVGVARRWPLLGAGAQVARP
jgi:hypothetical protein